jgi:hypothetical protein
VEHQPAAPIFLALQESALGHVMRSSPALYPAVEILHILGFVVLVGSILALDFSASARKRCLDECALLREERFLAQEVCL